MTIFRICKDCKTSYNTDFADEDFQKCLHCDSLNTEVKWNKDVEKIFKELQKSVKNGMEAIDRGEGVSLEEVRHRFKTN